MKQLIHRAIQEQAALRPDAIALVQGPERLSYGDVEILSNRLANTLGSAGLARGERAMILAPKTPMTVTSLLAVLKADGVYVPVDPSSPAPRLAKILGASRPRWILTVPECAGLLDGMLSAVDLPEAPSVLSLTEAPVIGSHFVSQLSRTDWERAPATPPAERSTAADPAHLLFTSGSTGTPKGVVITHANVHAYVQWCIRHFSISADDRHSAHAPLHFDLSTMDIYSTLGAGAQLHLVPASANLMPHKLAEMIRSAELTQWFSVPSVWTYLAKLDVVKPGDFPSVKRMLWCGEVLPTPTLRYFMERVPHARFTNLYGPTEATIASTYYDVPEIPADPVTPVPIGIPCDGEGVVILDQHGQPLADGERGELCIRGVGLSPGYWEDPEKTAKAFIPDPEQPSERIYRTGDLAVRDADGVVHFHGRADTQVKSRGYRIELGEIEAALATLPDLAESAVVAVATDGFEGHTICCAYAVAEGIELSQAALRKQLGALLPSYMLPARWLALDVLPKNPNGKADKPRLREMFENAVAGSPT